MSRDLKKIKKQACVLLKTEHSRQRDNKIKESRSCLHVSETLRLPVCSEHNEGGTSGKGPGQGIGGTKACSSWQGKSEENPLEGF